MTQAFKLDFNNGMLQVFGSSGELQFDSRYSGLRVHLHGNASIYWRDVTVNPLYGTDAYATVYYTKTFTKPPYVLSVFVRNDSTDLALFPRLFFNPTSTFLNGGNGHWTVADLSALYLMNLDANPGNLGSPDTRKTAYYLILENGVEG